MELEHKHPSRRWTDLLKHRWQTVLGIAVAALTVFDLQGGTELVAREGRPWRGLRALAQSRPLAAVGRRYDAIVAYRRVAVTPVSCP